MANELLKIKNKKIISKNNILYFFCFKFISKNKKKITETGKKNPIIAMAKKENPYILYFFFSKILKAKKIENTTKIKIICLYYYENYPHKLLEKIYIK